MAREVFPAAGALEPSPRPQAPAKVGRAGPGCGLLFPGLHRPILCLSGTKWTEHWCGGPCPGGVLAAPCLAPSTRGLAPLPPFSGLSVLTYKTGMCLPPSGSSEATGQTKKPAQSVVHALGGTMVSAHVLRLWSRPCSLRFTGILRRVPFPCACWALPGPPHLFCTAAGCSRHFGGLTSCLKLEPPHGLPLLLSASH